MISKFVHQQNTQNAVLKICKKKEKKDQYYEKIRTNKYLFSHLFGCDFNIFFLKVMAAKIMSCL